MDVATNNTEDTDINLTVDTDINLTDTDGNDIKVLVEATDPKAKEVMVTDMVINNTEDMANIAIPHGMVLIKLEGKDTEFR